MSILWRSWLTFTAVIAVVLGVLATLAVLQHNAILSDLIRQRLTVVAQTTAASFRSVVDLGLPLSIMRSADRVLARGLEIDPTITAIHVFNPSGIVHYSTESEKPDSVSRAVLRAQDLSDGRTWSVETPDDLNSGYTVADHAGDDVGGVVVVYPKEDFNTLRHAMVVRSALLAAVLLAVFSASAFLILRLRLSGAINGLNRFQALLAKLLEGAKPTFEPNPDEKSADAAGLGSCAKRSGTWNRSSTRRPTTTTRPKPSWRHWAARRRVPRQPICLRSRAIAWRSNRCRRRRWRGWWRAS